MLSKIAGLAAGLLLLAVLAAADVQAALTGILDISAPSASAQADIPANYLRLYQDAAAVDCPGLDWTLLAGIGKVESDHGRSTAPGVTSGQNPAGAGVISGSALVSRHVRVVGDTPRAGEVSAGYES